VELERVFERDAELVLLASSGNVGMGLRIDVRIYPQAYARLFASGLRQLIDPMQLGRGLDVEAQNPGLERLSDLLPALAHAGEHAFARVCSRSQHTGQLTSRHDIEAAAEAGKQIQHGEVGIGLDRIADEVRMRSERAVESGEGGAQRGPRVDIARCAELT